MLTLRTHTLAPLSLMDDVRRQLDWFFGADPFTAVLPDRSTAAPRFVARRTEAGLEVQADLPGVLPEHLSVQVESGVVRVKGERAHELAEGYKALRRERVAGRFERSFTLPEGLDGENAQADLKHGVLTLRFPLLPEKQARVIDVKVA
jgi:HSP20 family protein